MCQTRGSLTELPRRTGVRGVLRRGVRGRDGQRSRSGELRRASAGVRTTGCGRDVRALDASHSLSAGLAPGVWSLFPRRDQGPEFARGERPAAPQEPRKRPVRGEHGRRWGRLGGRRRGCTTARGTRWPRVTLVAPWPWCAGAGGLGRPRGCASFRSRLSVVQAAFARVSQPIMSHVEPLRRCGGAARIGGGVRMASLEQ